MAHVLDLNLEPKLLFLVMFFENSAFSDDCPKLVVVYHHEPDNVGVFASGTCVSVSGKTAGATERPGGFPRKRPGGSPRPGESRDARGKKQNKYSMNNIQG